MPTLDLMTVKSCSHIAYGGLKGESWQFDDQSVWTVLDSWSWMITGFKAVLLRQAGAGNVTVLAFAGSDSIRDFIADAAQVVGILPVQYPQAAMLTRRNGSQPNLNLIGHSLGGGLANYCALLTGLPSSTVNPAPLVAAAYPALSALPRENITNYIAGGSEFVSSSFGLVPGKRVTVAAEGNFFMRHSLNRVAPHIAMPRRV